MKWLTELVTAGASRDVGRSLKMLAVAAVGLAVLLAGAPGASAADGDIIGVADTVTIDPDGVNPRIVWVTAKMMRISPGPAKIGLRHQEGKTENWWIAGVGSSLNARSRALTWKMCFPTES